jgi:hypothetical protein
MTLYCARRLRENSLGNDSGWLPGGGTLSSSTSFSVRLWQCTGLYAAKHDPSETPRMS